MISGKSPFQYWIEKNMSGMAASKEIMELLAKAFDGGKRYELENQTAQEPVAWVTPDGEGWRMRFDPPINEVPLGWTPLYAAPVRTKDLTDDEIVDIWNRNCGMIDRCRAVIAADREKNK